MVMASNPDYFFRKAAALASAGKSDGKAGANQGEALLRIDAELQRVDEELSALEKKDGDKR